jgi:hypothetical protein
MRIFGPAFAFALLCSSVAHGFCMPTNPHHILTDPEGDYKEVPALIGDTKDGGKLTLYVSKERRTFTIIVKPVADPQIWCLVATGVKLRPFVSEVSK